MRNTQKECARSFARARHAEALDLLRRLARIPAPSHDEGRRASFVCEWLHANGMEGAFVDQALNVVCPLGDDGVRDLVVFAAHMDVVFPDTDELELREENGRLYAPGVGDDTANLVALMLAIRELARSPELRPRDVGVLFVANSCEEGLGNLKGTRQVFATYGQRIRRFYSFDLYLPGYVCEAVGSHRWRITVRTPGGHSLKDFGTPNAIERLCSLVEDLYGLSLPEGSFHTLNVGTIEGGTSVNAIASEASMLFEYRSTTEETLSLLRERMKEAIESKRSDSVRIELESMGERPGGGTPSPLQPAMNALTRDILRTITGEEPTCEPASTDANVPLSMSIPANTVGAIRGGLLHTREEWVDAASMEDGLAVVLGLMLEQDVLDS